MKAIAMVVDESAAPSAVLSTYRTLVQKPDRVILVHVRTTTRTPMVREGYQAAPDGLSAQNLSLSKQALENAGAAHVTTAVIRDDELPGELLTVTEGAHADLIVFAIGTTAGSRRPATGRSVLAVERQAPVPVVVVQQRTRAVSNTHDWNGRELYAA